MRFCHRLEGNNVCCPSHTPRVLFHKGDRGQVSLSSFLPLQHGCCSLSQGLKHNRHFLRNISDLLCECSMGFMEKKFSRELRLLPFLQSLWASHCSPVLCIVFTYLSIILGKLLFFGIWLYLPQVNDCLYFLSLQILDLLVVLKCYLYWISKKVINLKVIQFFYYYGGRNNSLRLYISQSRR